MVWRGAEAARFASYASASARVERRLSRSRRVHEYPGLRAQFRAESVETRNASGCAGRQIDGLVLTKFDTIDDKVGATLSMTYKTGQPIVFIGVGQKYTHLKKLSVNAIVNSLFS